MWLPLAQMTARHLLRMELIELCKTLWGILFHTGTRSFANCWTLQCYHKARTPSHISSETCSIGLRSGLHAGRFVARTLLFWSNRRVKSTVWHRALSCASISRRFPCTRGMTCALKIWFWYCAPFRFPFTSTRSY